MSPISLILYYKRDFSSIHVLMCLSVNDYVLDIIHVLNKYMYALFNMKDVCMKVFTCLTNTLCTLLPNSFKFQNNCGNHCVLQSFL